MLRSNTYGNQTLIEVKSMSFPAKWWYNNWLTFAAYAYLLSISFSKDPIPKDDNAPLFQSPKSKRKVLLGPASDSPTKHKIARQTGNTSIDTSHEFINPHSTSFEQSSSGTTVHNLNGNSTQALLKRKVAEQPGKYSYITSYSRIW